MLKKRTTKQLIEESISDLLQKEPFESITVTDIISNCNISRRTFYYYFKDKFDLVEQIFLEDLMNFYEVCGDKVSRNRDIFTRYHFEAIKRRSAFYAKILRDSWAFDKYCQIVKATTSAVSEGAAKHPESWGNYFHTSSVSTSARFVLDWVTDGCVMPIDDAIVTMWQLQPVAMDMNPAQLEGLRARFLRNAYPEQEK